MNNDQDDQPPANTQRISVRAQMPQERTSAVYVITNDGKEPRTVTLQKNKRQIMDLLLQGPVFCASPVRISDIVFILKREIELDVETKMYPGDPTTGAGDYGVYFLKSHVERISDLEAAA